MSNINNNFSSNASQSINLGAINDSSKPEERGIAYRYMQLLLSQARSCKAEVEFYMKLVEVDENTKNENYSTDYSKNMNEFIDAWIGKFGTDANICYDTKFFKFCERFGITLPPSMADMKATDYAQLSAEDRAYLKEKFQTVKEAVANPNAEKYTVYINNYMGQYNAYVDGASKASSDLVNIIKSIAGRM